MHGVELHIGRENIECNIDEDKGELVRCVGVTVLESYRVNVELPTADITVGVVHEAGVRVAHVEPLCLV